MRKLYGLVVPPVSPMDENGQADLDSATSLCQYLSTSEAHALYPLGTTGESLLLSQEEREALSETFLRVNAGRLPIYVQCGALTTTESAALVAHARQAGADGAGLMTPAFMPVDEASMRGYYDSILDEFPGFPIYAYNIASRTGNDLSPLLLRELMGKHNNLMGIKYSGSDLLRVQEYLDHPRRTADVLIGCDQLALSVLLLGGRGFVSGPGALMPKVYAAIYDSFVSGDIGAAREAQLKVCTLHRYLKDIPEIPAIKYLLWKAEIIRTPICRPPLRRLDRIETSRLDEALRFIRSC